MEQNGFYRDQWAKQLDERFKGIEERIESIENNHLPHLQSRLDSIEKKMAYYAGGITVAGFVVQWIIKML